MVLFELPEPADLCADCDEPVEADELLTAAATVAEFAAAVRDVVEAAEWDELLHPTRSATVVVVPMMPTAMRDRFGCFGTVASCDSVSVL